MSITYLRILNNIGVGKTNNSTEFTFDPAS